MNSETFVKVAQLVGSAIAGLFGFIGAIFGIKNLTKKGPKK